MRYYTPRGRFVHVPPAGPRCDWATDFGEPWWKDERYKVGRLSAKTRWIRVINTLTSQEQRLEVSGHTAMKIRPLWRTVSKHKGCGQCRQIISSIHVCTILKSCPNLDTWEEDIWLPEMLDNVLNLNRRARQSNGWPLYLLSTAFKIVVVKHCSIVTLKVKLTFRAFVHIPLSRCALRRPWLRSYSDTYATTHTPAATLGNIMALSWTWAAHWAKTTFWMRMSSFSSFDWTRTNSHLRFCCTSTTTSQRVDITSGGLSSVLNSCHHIEIKRAVFEFSCISVQVFSCSHYMSQISFAELLLQCCHL